MLRNGPMFAALIVIAITLAACGGDAPQVVTVVVTATPEPATSEQTSPPLLSPLPQPGKRAQQLLQHPRRYHRRPQRQHIRPPPHRHLLLRQRRHQHLPLPPYRRQHPPRRPLPRQQLRQCLPLLRRRRRHRLLRSLRHRLQRQRPHLQLQRPPYRHSRTRGTLGN